jgi:hypothetical protein
LFDCSLRILLEVRKARKTLIDAARAKRERYRYLENGPDYRHRAARIIDSRLKVRM